ncbi:MAG: NAD(P)-binding protein [Gammaproteobacteria bacterium]|nr:NAD(P)-binding protein [Gammaproteobacteria bacterium]
MAATGNVERIVVVGTGECGARVARELRERGFAGAITMIGDEPHTTYERPPLSKSALISDEISPVEVLPVARLAEFDVELMSGTAVESLDRDRMLAVLSDGGEVPYDRLLLATGARARTLPIAGGEFALTLRTIDDARALRAQLGPGRSVTVIGAGLIGLEVAASARQLGCDVTVLEVAPRALGRALPAEMADVLVKRHAEEGVEVLCGVLPTGISRLDGGLAVGVEGFDQPITADVVIAGIGVTPNVELAQAAGLRCENGIAVNDRLRTDDPAIFAAGDCCSFPHPLYGGRRIRLESWRNAHDQAAVAAANMLDGDEQHAAVPWFWSDQYDLGLQHAGLADEAASAVVRDSGNGSQIRFALALDGRLVAASGVGPGTSTAKDIRVAEMLIAAGNRPDPEVVADASVPLKELIKS